MITSRNSLEESLRKMKSDSHKFERKRREISSKLDGSLACPGGILMVAGWL